MFLVVDPDRDGWTLVRRSSNRQEGFVPSAYIKIL